MVLLAYGKERGMAQACTSTSIQKRLFNRGLSFLHVKILFSDFLRMLDFQGKDMALSQKFCGKKVIWATDRKDLTPYLRTQPNKKEVLIILSFH